MIDIQLTLDSIASEIKEYEFSKTLVLERLDFQVLYFHIQRMGKFEVFEIRLDEHGWVKVQFTKNHGHYPEFHERDWEGYPAVDTVANFIAAQVYATGISSSWCGGTPRYESLKFCLSKINIVPLEEIQEGSPARINVIFAEANQVSVPHDPSTVVQHMASDDQLAGALLQDQIARHKPGYHPPISASLTSKVVSQSVMWSRKGQYSVRLQLYSVSPAIKPSRPLIQAVPKPQAGDTEFT